MVQPRNAPSEPAESEDQGQSPAAGLGGAASSASATQEAPPPKNVPAPPPSKGYAHLFKFVLIGESGVGKTSLVRRYVRDQFSPSRDYTIGIDFDIKTVALSNGDQVKLQLWDTAGQERFRTITSSYYRGCHAIIIVYDANDQESFDSISRWMTEVSRYCNDDVVVVIAGNMADKRTPTSKFYGKDEVKELDLVKKAELEVVGVYECSCKTGEGVEEVFQAVVDELVTRRLDARNPLRKRKGFHDASIKLGAKDNQGKKKGCC